MSSNVTLLAFALLAAAASSSACNARPAPGATGATLQCDQPAASAVHARMLSPSQYDNTVLDLLSVGGNPAKDFAGGVDVQLDDLGIEQRANAAAEVARRAVMALPSWSPCDPAVTGVAACAQQIIDQFGRRAFRRPLGAVERTQLQALFDAGLQEKDFATGLEWFLTGVLQSPDFLYQFARPQLGERPGQVLTLSEYELASRLSYFLWDSTPDDDLLAAAAAHRLDAGASLDTELQRMIEDPRSRRGITGFYSTWLDAAAFDEVARDDPAFTGDVARSLRTSLLLSATQLHAGGQPNIAELFSGQTYFLDGALRGYYKLPGGTSDFEPIEMPGEGRRGILTHPGLLALLARPDASNPIARGLFVRRQLLCQEMEAPQSFVIPPLPPITPGLSTRERLTQHTLNLACATCHDQIDPPGFALESFDQTGRYRAVDGGKPIDSSGIMVNAGDLDGPFAQGDELLRRIGDSRAVKTCFAQRYLEHALARRVAAQDRCSLEPLQKSFATSGDLDGLVTSIARADSFRLRLAEGGPGAP